MVSVSYYPLKATSWTRQIQSQRLPYRQAQSMGANSSDLWEKVGLVGRLKLSSLKLACGLSETDQLRLSVNTANWWEFRSSTDSDLREGRVSSVYSVWKAHSKLDNRGSMNFRWRVSLRCIELAVVITPHTEWAALPVQISPPFNRSFPLPSMDICAVPKEFNYKVLH
jgi:hypothetical protein